MKHKYNWLPDQVDSRDINYTSRKLRLGLMELPEKVDLSGSCSEIENQLKIGSCTANALVGNMEFLEKEGQNKQDQKKPTDLSRLFIYYNERLLEGTAGEDGGASLRDGIKVLHKLGVCEEAIWPYLETEVLTKPSVSSYVSALKRRISSYESLKTIEDMKDCLASGFPFVFGFRAYSSFESQQVAVTGSLNLPTNDESFLGGHAVMAVGYDDVTSRFLVRNSWGIGWGDKGYFTIPYAYLSNPKLALDFWTIKK